MTNERLLGRLTLTIANADMPNNALQLLCETASFVVGPDGPARVAYLRRALKEGLPAEAPKHSLFTVIATTEQSEFAETKTRTRFLGFPYRDSHLDSWLPETQPATDACVITTLGLNKDWLFAETARALPGVEQASDITALGRSLIANGYTMTLAQAEDMVERTKCGEATGIRADGYQNLFFVETGDENEPVSVGTVLYGGSGWHAYVYRLDGARRWEAGGQLLVRNLDASKL